MADELEYVVHGALMICDKGTAPGFFNPIYNSKTKVNGCLVTTAMDKLPITNIPSFTVCSISQKPCIPVSTEWENTYKVKVQGQETLLVRSCMKCGLGGKIEFVTSGQIPLPQDAMDDIKAMQEAGAEPEEEGWGWWDTAELIPVVGSAIGIFREAKKGNGWMALANVGFLVADVAGVISFGATTAASTAGKTALKGGVKIAGKSAAKAAAKKVGKTGIKTALKLTAKGAKEAFKKSIDDVVKAAKKVKEVVTANKNVPYDKLGKIAPCLLRGTLIGTQEGLIPVENVQQECETLSYDFESGDYVLKPVQYQFNNWANKYYQIRTNDNEIFLVTGRHLFWINNANRWKAANQINKGDVFKTQQGIRIFVIDITCINRIVKTYNLEILDTHNYLIGKNGILVHNQSKPSIFEDKTKRDVKIYEIYDKKTGKVQYVGQTERSVDGRFKEHCLEGKKKNNFKNDWNKKAKVRTVKQGRWTSYEASVWEQHYIEKNGGKTNLFNRRNEISKKKYDFYSKLHNPCK